jgi:HlyD family secretion protein
VHDGEGNVTAKKRILIVLVVAGLSAIGYTIWTRVSERENADTLTLYGNVDIREVELAFRVPGRLQAMYFDEGDSVEAGERLAELDAKPYREALAVAEARVSQARAQVDKFKAGTRPQEIARAQAGVSQASSTASAACWKRAPAV